MTLLRTATIAAFLTAGAFSAHADVVQLDETQLDQVTAGFFDFETIQAILPEGVVLPDFPLPVPPFGAIPNFPELPVEPPFGAIPNFPFAR